MDVTLQFAVKLVTDLVLFIEPIPILWNLNLPRIKKAGLVIMFSSAYCMLLSSSPSSNWLNWIAPASFRSSALPILVKRVQIKHVSLPSSPVMKRRTNESVGLLVDPIDWSSAEVCALVICGCIPYLRNFIAAVPILNRALGLSSLQSIFHHSNAKEGNSIALQSRRTAYISPQSRKLRHGKDASLGVTTVVTAERDSEAVAEGSTEEILPYHVDGSGGIMVTIDLDVSVGTRRTSSDLPW